MSMYWAVYYAFALLSVFSELTVPAYSDVHTSIARVKSMVRNERNMLGELQRNLPDTFRESEQFVKFYRERIIEIEDRNLTLAMQQLNHPNAVFFVLMDFAKRYSDLRNFYANPQKANMKYLPAVANHEDVIGAITALLRLQEVYKLKVMDIVEGTYFNTEGPPLSYFDTYLVGDTAFNSGQPHQSILWLEVSADLKSDTMDTQNESKGIGNVSLAHISAVLGRAYLKTGQEFKARRIYETWKIKDEEEMVKLARELDQKPTPASDHTHKRLQDLHRLCATHGKMLRKRLDPRLTCRYRGQIPYFRYQEEVLSESPYTSVFYDVITDREIRTIQKLSLTKMSRATVATPSGPLQSLARTSQIAFLDDHMSKAIMRVSNRVGYMTGLETKCNLQGFLSPTQSSSEPIQVVNYGVGGHFSIHMDPFKFRNKATENLLTYSGNRLATFLIYLSDVDVGGYTAFPKMDLILRPIKSSAVFWYNYNPAGNLETKTWHAGCPVGIGEKWIINKWILSYGNTFVRRCGLSIGATQLDIEEDMMRGYTSINSTFLRQ